MPFRTGCRTEEITQRRPALADLVQRRCWRRASRQGRRKTSWVGGKPSRGVIRKRLNRVSYADKSCNSPRRSAQSGLVPASHPGMIVSSLLCLRIPHRIADHNIQHPSNKAYSVSRFKSAFDTQTSPSACSTTRDKATFMATCQLLSPSAASS